MVFAATSAPPAMRRYASDESPIGAWITSMPISIANSAADWTFATFWKDFPRPQDGPVRGRHRLDPDFLERADSPPSTAPGPTATSARRPERHLPQAFHHLLHRGRVRADNRHDIGMDLICWECGLPSLGRRLAAFARDFVEGHRSDFLGRHRQDHPPERDAGVQLRSVRRSRANRHSGLNEPAAAGRK